MPMPDIPAVTTIETTPGHVDVRLEEIPSSGYRWSIASVPEQVTFIADAFQSASASTRAIGASGAHVFTFRVDTVGEFDVDFVRKRAWETEPLERRRVRLVVRPGA